MGPRIFNLPPQVFATLEWWYHNCKKPIGWTKGHDGQIFYNPFAPILHCNYEGHPDVHKLFLNQVLFDVSDFLFILK